mmetsp:Transcript_81108/g.173466  ORF Transcript_81108/g.173466 Transcript_81108/m.173466 type:complete len:720 (+) Transcript_81108:154-2313(+)
MRIFIHNVDTFLGKALVKELRRTSGGFHRVFGTVAANAADAPSTVKRIVSRGDPKRDKKMTETMQSCKLVVIDLFNCTMEDLHFAIQAMKVDPKSNPPKPTGELENDVVFVVISSVMVWAATPIENKIKPTLRETDYMKRMPVAGSKYEQWKEMENLVMNCFNREESRVKGLVVAGGILYGDGEETFSRLFKDAWRGLQEEKISAPGTNHVPTVHVRDLSRLVRQVGTLSEINAMEAPYYLAVDRPPAPEGKNPAPPTQMEIFQGVIDELSEHYAVDAVPAETLAPPPPPPPSAEEGEGTGEAAVELSVEELEEGRLREAMAIDLHMEASPLMASDPTVFAADSEPPGWWCEQGIVANMRKIADEFTAERKLRAMKVLIAGPPASGKSTLAKAISEHFKIPHLDQGSKGVDDLMIELSSNVCRYRGYVLDSRGMDFEHVEKLFRYDVELPPADDPAEPTEGEEAPAKKFDRRLNDKLCPSFVIVLQASEELCRKRWESRDSNSKESLKAFHEAMYEYRSKNLTDNVHSLSDFFQDVARPGEHKEAEGEGENKDDEGKPKAENKSIGVFNLPVQEESGTEKAAEDIFESGRIYMEREGRPFNYLPTEEEVAAGLLERLAAKDKAEAERKQAEAAKLQSTGTTFEDAETKRQAERLRLVAEHEEEQRRLEELPLREYLMKYMVPTLTEGLIEVCKVLPDNPVDYLSTYLESAASDTKPPEH